MRDVKSQPESLRNIEEKAKAATNKKAAFGEDINLNDYNNSSYNHDYQKDLSNLPAETKRKMLDIGVNADDTTQRSGTFIQIDNTPIHSNIEQEGIDLMPLSEALEKYSWLPDYMWKAVAVDSDKYTAHVELHRNNGYFIRALPGAKSVYPIQSCLYIGKAGLAQNVHNIIIAEEGSELHIITGCAMGSGEDPGLHLGVSEFYIKKGAKVSFTMIHSWNQEMAVRPRTGIIVEENGLYMSNYILMRPVKSIQTNPTAKCVGENSTVRFNSVLLATPGSTLDIGSRVILDAKGARAELVSRAITKGGNIIARGYIEGNFPGVKGHLECRGLLLNNSGTIYSIPELMGTVAGIDLSHEAAVGKIAEEEVEYLMARGLTHDEATAAIVRGFLHVDIKGLPPLLNAELQKAVESSEQEFM